MRAIIFVIISGVALLAASAVLAQDYQHVTTQEGVEVMVKYDPLGPNNLVVAYVKFVNNNKYTVNVDWTPTITCEGGDVKVGYGAGFSMNEGKSYGVNIWRSAACGPGRIKDFSVDMEVKRASP
jgi:hypothetical protein